MLPVSFDKLGIVVRKHANGRIQVVKSHPECQPSTYTMTPADLNNDCHKYVHSAVVRKLKLHFKSDQTPGSIRPDYTCGYENLSNELLEELLQHLKHAQK
jgi:hypothetical protein